MSHKASDMKRMGDIAVDIVMSKAIQDRLEQVSATAEDDDPVEAEILRRQREEMIRRVQKGPRPGTLTGGLEEKTEKEFFSLVEAQKERVLAHFFHPDFEKCQLLSRGLMQIAHEHPETLFIRIKAETAPFLAQKLRVKVLPLLVFFQNGVAVSRIEGFEGFGNERSFEHLALVRRLAQVGVIRLNEEERASLDLKPAPENSDSDDN